MTIRSGQARPCVLGHRLNLSKAKLGVSRLFLPIVGLGLIGCASTIKVSERPDVLGLCPQYAPSEDSAVVQVWNEKVNEIANSDTAFLRPMECDPDKAAILNIGFDKTEIPTSTKRASAYAISAVGLSAPFILLALESPVWIVFFYPPLNKTSIHYGYWDKGKSQKDEVVSRISTASWYGGRPGHIKKQGSKVMDDIERQIQSIKKKK